jgi:hypothetical protein
MRHRLLGYQAASPFSYKVVILKSQKERKLETMRTTIYYGLEEVPGVVLTFTGWIETARDVYDALKNLGCTMRCTRP